MKRILDSFEKVAEKQQQLLILLGPKLKAVTGNTGEIDLLIGEVKDMTNNFKDFGDEEEFYDKAYKDKWTRCLNSYKDQCKNIEMKSIKLIKDTYSKLRNSISGFEFLQTFKNMDMLEQVTSELKNQYTKVLEVYSSELEENKAIFEAGKDKV